MIYCKLKKKGRWQKIKTKLCVSSMTQKMSTWKYPMGFREVGHLQGVTPGLSDFTITEGFFSSLTRDQVGTTVVKIEDAKISPTLPLPATKAWPSLPQITWASRERILTAVPWRQNCYIMPTPQNTRASKHTQPHTKSHLSATSREGEVLGPKPTAPSPPAASFPLR